MVRALICSLSTRAACTTAVGQAQIVGHGYCKSVANEDSRSGRSAAWGVAAGVFCTGAIATWQEASTPKSSFPDLPTYLFAVAAIAALYMCFATVWGWRPAGRPTARDSRGAAELAPTGRADGISLAESADLTLPAPAGEPVAGGLPGIWNLPIRNPGFTGRDGLLAGLRENLQNDSVTVVRALYGMGGVGKTQMAIEYAYRFSGDYNLAWWVDSQHVEIIGDQLANLAVELRVAESSDDTVTAFRALSRALRERDKWLLIFDNAENAQDLQRWLPSGRGHVVITSRTPEWHEIANSIEITTFRREESAQLLRSRVRHLAQSEAEQVAKALGDLPLAIVQAASLLADTGASVVDYLALLGANAGGVLAEARPVSYPYSLAAAVRISVARLRRQERRSARLLQLCSLLAPEPVPLSFFGPVTARWQRHRSVRSIVRFGLGRADDRGIQVHRLTQAIVRDQLSAAEVRKLRARAQAMLVAADPGDPDDSATWASWARLLPHTLALDPASSTNRELRILACRAGWYLCARGDMETAAPMLENLYQQWCEFLGRDNEHTLWAAHSLSWAWRSLGRHLEALRLDEESLEHGRNSRGEGHPHTLATASNLASDLRALGEFEMARRMDEDTLKIRRKVLGDEHRHTLRSANNLAGDLRKLGRFEEARHLDEDVFARFQKVLGENHPHTLVSANNLAEDLRALGHIDAARTLDESTLVRRQRVLGDNHPDTLRSAANLAADLQALGITDAARRLAEDTLIRRRAILGESNADIQALAQWLASNASATDERTGDGEDSKPGRPVDAS